MAFVADKASTLWNRVVDSAEHNATTETNKVMRQLRYDSWGNTGRVHNQGGVRTFIAEVVWILRSEAHKNTYHLVLLHHFLTIAVVRSFLYSP